MTRPDWDTYFINMLEAIGKRASCDRGRSAAILVKNHRIISTGYVGSPIGLPDCDELGHELGTFTENGETSSHCLRTFHAELNAILGCAREGVSTVGSTLYCSMVPCRVCGMAVIQAGIVRVVAANKYHKDLRTRDMFKKASIELKVMDENVTY